MKLHPATFLIAVLISVVSTAQKPAPPVSSDIKMWKIGDLVQYYNRFACHEKGVVMTHQNGAHKPNEVTLYAFDEAGVTYNRTLDLPVSHKTKHAPLNGVAMIGGKPCVFYDRWDKETGEIQFFMQHHGFPGLELEGVERKLGEVKVDPKKYDGETFGLRIAKSPNKKFTLVMYNGALEEEGKKEWQQGKLIVCWVFDEELNVAWSGSYQLPVLEWNSSARSWIMDNGHVYLRVNGESSEGKQAQDAPPPVQGRGIYKNHQLMYFELHDKTMNQWRDVPVDEANLLEAVQVGGRVFLAGVQGTRGKSDGPSSWVLYDAGERGLDPVLVKKDFLEDVTVNSLIPDEGRTHVGVTSDQSGNIIISRLVEGGTRVLKVSARGDVIWSELLPWDNALFAALGNSLVSYRWLEGSAMKQALDGQLWSEPKFATGRGGRPVVLVLDENGRHSVMEMLPQSEKTNQWHIPASRILSECGCFLYQGKDLRLKRVDFRQ